jgi:hypothetical protein
LVAVISAKGISKPFYQSIGDKGQYFKRVNDRVIQLRRETKQDIRVIITMDIIIKEISLPTAMSATQPTLTSIQRKKRVIATSRQRDQLEIMAAADKATRNHIPELKIAYKYRLRNCNNHDKCCYILGTTGHLLLNNRHLITWNNAINDGTASIKTPPMSLVGQIVAEQAKAKRSPFYSGQQITATSAILSSGIPRINQFFGVGARGLNRGFGITPEAEAAPQSSPPHYPGSDNRNLRLYVRFLIGLRPEQQQQLNRAQNALYRAGWGYSDLRNISKTEWKEMGIGGGTVKLLKNKMRSWEGPKDSNKSTNSSSGKNI